VTAARLFDDHRDDLIVCDMRYGRVLAYQSTRIRPPGARSPRCQSVPREVVDLDGDGRKDLLIADLGGFPPTDEQVGRVIWLRQRPDATFERSPC